MQSKATTVEQYLAELPEDRKSIIAEIRNVFKKNLPKGFEEEISYGMIGFVIPHSLYPKGYHCNPKLPLPFICIASQKNHFAIYHMGLYASKEVLSWFETEWTKHSSKKLEMGKSCLRFKKPKDVPLKLIAALAKKITTQQWIDTYEKAFVKK